MKVLRSAVSFRNVQTKVDLAAQPQILFTSIDSSALLSGSRFVLALDSPGYDFRPGRQAILTAFSRYHLGRQVRDYWAYAYRGGTDEHRGCGMQCALHCL